MTVDGAAIADRLRRHAPASVLPLVDDLRPGMSDGEYAALAVVIARALARREVSP